MKKLLVLFMGITLASLVWADADSDVQQTLRDMQARLQKQEQKINDLQRRLDETPVSREDVSAIVRQELDRTVDTAGWAQSKDMAGVVSLAENIKRLDIRGDLRLRWENRKSDPQGDPEQTWQGFQTRLRLGGVWQSNEGWEIGVGFVTGETSGDGYNSNKPANNSQDTWGSNYPFENGSIYLDYAYAKHVWENEGGACSLTLGQFPNPFVSSDIFWDEDVRPTGAVGQWNSGGVFVTLGAFELKNAGQNQGTDSEMVAGQVGYNGQVADGTSATLAASYYYYNAATPPSQNISNNTISDENYDYHIADLYGALSTAASDDVTVSGYGHVWKNFGASGDSSALGSSTSKDPGEMDLGYVVGASVGISKYKVGAEYAYVEADSVPSALSSNDFPVDLKGYRVFASVDCTKNFTIGLKYTDADSIHGTYSDDRDFDLLQIDATYRF